MTETPIPTSLPALAGATVIVTRPAASASALKRRIASLGGTALGLPGVGIRAIEDADAARAALREAMRADVAIFVSPNAARYAFALLPALRFAHTAQVCAVGRATAQALTRRGVRNVIWPHDRQDSEGLLALPQLARLRRRRVALIGAPFCRPHCVRAARCCKVSMYTGAWRRAGLAAISTRWKMPRRRC